MISLLRIVFVKGVGMGRSLAGAYLSERNIMIDVITNECHKSRRDLFGRSGCT